MKILSIETSCDETAMSIVNFSSKKKFTVLSDSVLSQIEIHKQYGGVYPAVAKREHLNNIFPLLLASLKTAKILEKRKNNFTVPKNIQKKLEKILDRDEHNLENILYLIENFKKPKIDAIAVTYGPGLEIALWTGFNIARALSEIWKIDLIPVNHMEGHIYSSLIVKNKKNNFEILQPEFPSLSLLISGGHTDLVLIKKEGKYKIIGTTLDDAVGEAYDKSARLLGISYPGGPEISKLAEEFEKNKKEKVKNYSSIQLNMWNKKNHNISLPRPMLQKNNFDFSFSGLKTAVLYLVKSQEKINKKFKIELSAEFENAVSEVLTKKTKKAIKKYGVKSLIIGGGVSANNRLRTDFKNFEKEFENFSVFLPNKKYTGDNALMIAVAGYYNFKNKSFKKKVTKVNGNLKLK